MHIFFFQAEDGIRDLVRSRGLGDVYKRQGSDSENPNGNKEIISDGNLPPVDSPRTSDTSEELSLIHI